MSSMDENIFTQSFSSSYSTISDIYASILISKGVDVVKVSKRLGHANAKITLETYAHLVPNEDNDLAEIFEKELEKIS